MLSFYNSRTSTWLGAAREQRKDTFKIRKLGSQMHKPHSTACLLCRVEERGRVTADTCTKRQAYFIINKEGFMRYSWLKETGLANLGNGEVSVGDKYLKGTGIWWGKTIVTIFCTPYQHLHVDQGKVWLCL